VSPIRFGPAGRELFGLFQLPTAGETLGQSVVICNPFGQEYVRCHRLIKVIADRLARAGFHVLRFDFFGTGDSAGDDGDGDLRQWENDIQIAHEEVSKLSGNASTSWLGLRLGGSIAATASLRVDIPPRRLVLWDPVADGASYIKELEASHVAGMGFLAHWSRAKFEQTATAAMQHEMLGFALSPVLRQQISEISPATLTSARAQQIEAFCDANTDHFKQLEKLLAASVSTYPIRLTPIETKIMWASNEAMNSAIVPSEALNSIVTAMLGAS
jgi:uncharacterized protein